MIVETLNTKSKVRTRNGFSNAAGFNFFDSDTGTAYQFADSKYPDIELGDVKALMLTNVARKDILATALSTLKKDIPKKKTKYLSKRQVALDCQAARDAANMFNRNKACSQEDLESGYKDWDIYEKDYKKALKSFNDYKKEMFDVNTEISKLGKEKERREGIIKSIISKKLREEKKKREAEARSKIRATAPTSKPKEKKPSYTKYYIIGGGALVIGVVGLILFRR